MSSRRVISAEEQDAYTRWRDYVAYLRHAGNVKKIKRRTHRRERRKGRAEIREQLEEQE
jgi:hypothetical protein